MHTGIFDLKIKSNTKFKLQFKNSHSDSFPENFVKKNVENRKN